MRSPFDRRGIGGRCDNVGDCATTLWHRRCRLGESRMGSKIDNEHHIVIATTGVYGDIWEEVVGVASADLEE